MRAVASLLAVLLLLWGCTPVSIHPTYSEDQLVSMPGLDGIWRSDGDELQLSAIDSVTYLLSLIDGDDPGIRQPAFLEARLARQNSVTLVDLVPTDQNGGGNFTFMWHLLPLHSFMLADVAGDSIVLRALDADSLKAIVRRTPGAISHIISDDRVVLTAPTREAQAFLIEATMRPGSAVGVYHRVPDSWSCEESPGETHSVDQSGISNQMLSKFGTKLRLGEASSVMLDGTVPSMRVAVHATGLLAVYDTTTWFGVESPVLLSRSAPLVVMTDRRNARRLELRWIGVEPGGVVKVHARDCHDAFPSSGEARQKLPAPLASSQYEGDPLNVTVRYAWRSVPGATAYEVLYSHNHDRDFRDPRFWERVIVRDTMFTRSMRNLGSHTWRVRAYASGIGFGPLSPIQRVPTAER